MQEFDLSSRGSKKSDIFPFSQENSEFRGPSLIQKKDSEDNKSYISLKKPDKVRILISNDEIKSEKTSTSKKGFVPPIDIDQIVNRNIVDSASEAETVSKEDISRQEKGEGLFSRERFTEPGFSRGSRETEFSRFSDEGNYYHEEGGFYEDDESPLPSERPLTEKEIAQMKRDELLKIGRLERKGYKSYKKFTMLDRYEEIREEREKLDDHRGLAESIKWQRKILMGATGLVEYLNKTYDPFDLKLNGWSETLYDSLDDYDEVFEELYYKYKDKVHVEPEIKLLFMWGGSGLMFHFSQKLMNNAEASIPGFTDVMRDNPGLQTQYEEAARRRMASQAPPNPVGNMIGNLAGNPMLGNWISGMFGGNQEPEPTRSSPMNASPPSRQKVNMKGPHGVDDILQDLEINTSRRMEDQTLNDSISELSTSTARSNVKRIRTNRVRRRKSWRM